MYSKEYIAILASFQDNIMLLATRALASGTGLNQSNAIYNMLNEWSVVGHCLSMCFDTTAFNTAECNGACILLESVLGHPLLWTACRHHAMCLR